MLVFRTVPGSKSGLRSVETWTHAIVKFSVILSLSSWNFTYRFALARRRFLRSLMTVWSLGGKLEPKVLGVFCPSRNTASQVDAKPWIHAQGQFVLIFQQSSWNFTGSFALVRRTFWQCLMTVGSLCRDLERSRGVSRDFGVSRREHMLSWNFL